MGQEISNPKKQYLPLYNRYRNAVYWDDGPNSIVMRDKERTFIPNNPDDKWHTVTADTVRLDQISHLYYGTYAFWWVIADANRIANPLIPQEIGTVLRIPDLTKLHASGYFD